MRPGASLDGKTTKGRASKRREPPASGGQKGILETLYRKDPELGLKPASPPKKNPWTRNMNSHQTGSGPPPEDPALLKVTKDNADDEASKKSTCASCTSTKGDSLSSGSETVKAENDDQEGIAVDQAPSPRTFSVWSSTPHPTETNTHESPRPALVGSLNSRRALLAAATRAEEKYEVLPQHIGSEY